MRVSPPDLPGNTLSDSPLDRALAMLLAGERDAALRWSAAVVKHDPSTASALILTCRLLAEAGRNEAAVEGFEVAIKRAINSGNLPLAVAAVGDLRKLGVSTSLQLDAIAEAFCRSSARLRDNALVPPPLRVAEHLEPLSSFLSGPALLSKATEIVHDATKQFELEADVEPQALHPVPLFSSLEKAGLRALIEAFEMITVSAGHAVIEEGSEGAEAYIVARGELDVRRASTVEGDEPTTLARLTGGALFGEMALLARTPRVASVVACRPSILLVATRDELERVAQAQPDVGLELAAHCRRRMVANLVRTSPALLAVHPDERTALVERFETAVFDKGQKLITAGDPARGLHLVASGEVSVVGREGGDSFVIATLGPGQVVGEVALVLRRAASADVIAVHPTVTLYLPESEFLSLIHDHPAILQGLYLLAVRRDEETSMVMANSTTDVTEEFILV